MSNRLQLVVVAGAVWFCGPATIGSAVSLGDPEEGPDRRWPAPGGQIAAPIIVPPGAVPPDALVLLEQRGWDREAADPGFRALAEQWKSHQWKSSAQLIPTRWDDNVFMLIPTEWEAEIKLLGQ